MAQTPEPRGTPAGTPPPRPTSGPIHIPDDPAHPELRVPDGEHRVVPPPLPPNGARAPAAPRAANYGHVAPLPKPRPAAVVPMTEKTRGQKVSIAGRTVQLPPDAALAGPMLVEIVAEPGKTVDMSQTDTLLMLVVPGSRGSEAAVGMKTRRVGEKIAPGDPPDTFAFLKEALK